MISGLGGGMRGMPSMDAMRSMQQKQFDQADADGSGGLDVTEFETMMKDAPLRPGGSAGSSDVFKSIDGDGDGQLTQSELDASHERMMSRFQSTMQTFGQGGTVQGGEGTRGSLASLLESLRAEDESDTGASSASSSTAEDSAQALGEQLRTLFDTVSSRYANAGFDPSSRLLAAA